MSQITLDDLIAANAYAQDFLTISEALPDEVQRLLSEMLELDVIYQNRFCDLMKHKEKVIITNAELEEFYVEFDYLLNELQYISDKKLDLSSKIVEVIETSSKQLDSHKKFLEKNDIFRLLFGSHDGVKPTPGTKTSASPYPLSLSNTPCYTNSYSPYPDETNPIVPPWNASVRSCSPYNSPFAGVHMSGGVHNSTFLLANSVTANPNFYNDPQYFSANMSTMSATADASKDKFNQGGRNNAGLLRSKRTRKPRGFFQSHAKSPYVGNKSNVESNYEYDLNTTNITKMSPLALHGLSHDLEVATDFTSNNVLNLIVDPDDNNINTNSRSNKSEKLQHISNASVMAISSTLKKRYLKNMKFNSSNNNKSKTTMDSNEKIGSITGTSTSNANTNKSITTLRGRRHKPSHKFGANDETNADPMPKTGDSLENDASSSPPKQITSNKNYFIRGNRRRKSSFNTVSSKMNGSDKFRHTSYANKRITKGAKLTGITSNTTANNANNNASDEDDITGEGENNLLESGKHLASTSASYKQHGFRQQTHDQNVNQTDSDDEDEDREEYYFLGKPSDPDEPTYCLCNRISYGEMIGCDYAYCSIEWFHFECVGLAYKPKGKWYCPRCRRESNSKLCKFN